MANPFQDIVNQATSFVTGSAAPLVAQGQSIVQQAQSQVTSATSQLQAEADKLKGQIGPGVELIKLLADPAKRASIIEEIALESNVFPNITVKDPFASKVASGAGGSAQAVSPGAAVAAAGGWTLDKVMRLIKPKLTLQLRAVGPIELMPYGEPDPEAWKTPAMILGGGLALIAFLIFRGATHYCPSPSKTLRGVNAKPRARRAKHARSARVRS